MGLVQRHVRAARPQDGEGGDALVGRAGQQQTDPEARPHPGGAQPGSERVGAGEQFGVAQPESAADQGCGIGAFGRPVGDQIGHQAVQRGGLREPVGAA